MSPKRKKKVTNMEMTLNAKDTDLSKNLPENVNDESFNLDPKYPKDYKYQEFVDNFKISSQELQDAGPSNEESTNTNKNNSKNCGNCDYKFNKNSYSINCLKCAKWHCLTCANITDEEACDLYKTKQKWVCRNCSSLKINEKKIEDLEKENLKLKEIINELNRKIEILIKKSECMESSNIYLKINTIEDKLNKLINNLEKSSTDTSVTLENETVRVSYNENEKKHTDWSTHQNNKNILKEKNILTIKPINQQDNIQTKKELSKYINPAKLDVDITRIQDFENGTIKIHCNKKEDIEKIESEINKKLKSNYTVKQNELILPKIKIVGIEENMTKEDLVKSLISKNKILTNSKINVKVIKKMKTKYMAIVEIDGKCFKEIIEKGMVFVEFSVCTVFEYFDITRCFKCSGYNHMSQNCTKDKVCMKCGNTKHDASNCQTKKENVVCPNCTEINKKFNLGYMVNHNPFDIKCQTYQSKIKKVKSNINYEK